MTYIVFSSDGYALDSSSAWAEYDGNRQWGTYDPQTNPIKNTGGPQFYDRPEPEIDTLDKLIDKFSKDDLPSFLERGLKAPGQAYVGAAYVASFDSYQASFNV